METLVNDMETLVNILLISFSLFNFFRSRDGVEIHTSTLTFQVLLQIQPTGKKRSLHFPSWQSGGYIRPSNQSLLDYLISHALEAAAEYMDLGLPCTYDIRSRAPSMQVAITRSLDAAIP